MAMTGEGWGERRERGRRTRRWVIAGSMAAVAAGFAMLLPETAATSTKAWATAAVLVAVLVGGVLSWRYRDELERRRATMLYATIGGAALFLFPLLRIGGPLLGIADPGLAAWSGAVLAGVAVCVVERVRG